MPKSRSVVGRVSVRVAGNADPKGVLKPATDIGLTVTSVASYTNTSDMERAVNMVKACSNAGIKRPSAPARPSRTGLPPPTAAPA